MSLYRCAACGSPNVVTDTQNQGYNYLKGAVGTAILGAGGAAAGINGKKATVYKCPDCGLTMNEPMAAEIKVLIDMGVRSYDARKNLLLRGVPIDWSILKNKYKNIESGSADAKADSVDAQLAFDYTSDEGKAFLDQYRALVESLAEELYQKQSAWETEQEEKYRKQLIELSERRETLLTRQEQLKEAFTQNTEKLSALGFLKFADKRKINQELEKIREEGVRNEAELEKIDKDEKSAQSSLETYESKKSYSINTKMGSHRARAVFNTIGRAMTAEQIADIALYYWGEDAKIGTWIVKSGMRLARLDGEADLLKLDKAPYEAYTPM